jgi:peptidoglycan hydrolase-like protein with peptidoglycan-binding domain
VRELQQLLNRAGVQPPLADDGIFGPKTDAALRQFQTSQSIGIDGKFGPESLGALQRSVGQIGTQANAPTRPNIPPVSDSNLTHNPSTPRPRGTDPTPAPASTPAATPATTPDTSRFAPEAGRVTSAFGRTRAEREQQAESILRTNGQWPPQNGRTYAIQIDQDSPPSNASQSARSNHLRSYTGQTSVFRAENGRLVEQNSNPLRSASHPGQFSTRSGTPDVNGDGRRDIAHVRPGVYQYGVRTSNSRFNPTNDAQFRVARDLNQDGVIDAREANRGYSASGIQIHAGTSSRPSSTGCQTMPPNDFRAFQDAIRRSNSSGQNSFTYVLVRRPNETSGENRF